MAKYEVKSVGKSTLGALLWILRFSVFAVSVLITGLYFCFNALPTHAIAKESTTTVTFVEDVMTISDMMPGTFEKSPNSTVTVETDNYTGYSMSVRSATNSTSLTDGNNHEITSINSAVSESIFSTDPTYYNKWGYKPSQYISSSGGVDTVISNSNYLPAPSVSGDLLAKTSAANITADTYTLSFATKVDTTLPAGTYTYTYVLMIVPNAITFNITYDDNTVDTVSNMPSPNPAEISLDGGTPTSESYVTLSDAVPVRNDKKFAGWCDVATTTDLTSGDDVCSGNLYRAGDNFPVDQTAGPNITLYAVWVETLFPIVWNQMGACEFHGATNGNITGSECTDYHNVRFIDTGIALYSQANYQKDYEIHFTIDHYLPTEQVNYYGSEDNSQQTFVNDKLSTTAGDGKAPGIVVRRNGTNIEVNSKLSNTHESESLNYTHVQDVSVFRLDNVIYYSINNGPLIMLQDISGFNQQFNLTTWFGGYPKDDCTGDNGPCTDVKRIPEATLSNMYIKLGEYSDDDVHEISFKTNDGTSTVEATYLIKDGNSITTLPSAPVYTDHLFQGWFTASSGGTQVTAATVPDSSADYFAQWLSTVALANITNDSITLDSNDTETIIVTNSAELEPYTFTSNNTSVATVNANTGEITAVGPGSTTITMTGTTSGATKTISVTVTGATYTVSFDAQGGSSVSAIPVGEGTSINPLPTTIRQGFNFMGWFTGTNGTGTQLTTSTIFDANTPTQYYAYWEEDIYVCKIATTLHKEQCTKTGSNGCAGASWGSNWIDYGHLVASVNETPGAAYDCDVDYDGVFDDETERFYYFGTENGNAKLIHYVNQQSNASVDYNTAISYLPNYELDAENPSVPVWDNPYLVTYDSGDYAGKAARFMTYPEITNGLWSGGTNNITPSNNVSTYLFEQSNFAADGRTDGIWLEKQTNYNNRIQTNSRTLTHGSTSANAARATIEVPVQYMEPYTAPATYDITFDPHNGISSWTETIDAGDDLSDVYPATDPTYTDHLFQGWFTAASGGTAISSSTEPSGDTTYHAQWLGTVALATFASNSLSVEENDTVTISVTNSAEIEGYEFTSLDSTIATVDPITGVVTGVVAGTTSIRMTGASSLTFVDIPVTVTVAQVMYTVYFNPHNGSANSSATIVAGQAIGSSNIPADPTPTGVDEVFMGWFTAASGGTAVDGNTTPSADGETYHAQYKKIVCKLAADGTLHTATKTSSSTNTSPYYGQIANDPIPHAGDAYNCDVDYDDTYSAINERFYYVGQDTNNNAVLVAWNSYYNGAWAAGTSNDSIFSYTDALGQLPANTSGAWDNPGLIEQETGRAARFTTRAEVIHACGDINVSPVGALDVCDYFMEHSGYDGGGRSALWLMKENNTQYRIHGGSGNRQVSSSTGTSMVRPTIVVPDKLIEKYTSPVLDVTNAVIANNDLTVPVGGNITIQVSNSASLEPYTFSSQDSTIATVDSSTGVVTGVSAGTVNIIMTGTTSGLTKILEVDVLSSLPDHTVTFNANGGTLDDNASSTRTVTDGDEVGALPTASKTNHRFFGWYKDDGTFYEEVYADEIIEDDITFYAKWVEDTSSLPIVWSEINACTFNGNAVISGDNCTQNKTKKMVDTGVALFSSTNYQKDFEIGFTVVDYATASQSQNQATLVNSKYENSSLNYPGFVMRRSSDNGNIFQLTSRWSSGTPTDATFVAENLKTVKIVRESGVLKYSFNGGALTTYYDTSGNTHRFDTRVWFGAAAGSNNETPQRYLVGTLTDMYVRMGAHTSYNVELDPNGGTLPSGVQSNYDIIAGDPVGALPTPTAPSASYVFGGWYDGNTLVSDGTQYIPTGDIILVADWVYNSSDTPVVFDVSNDATRGYKTIINQWVQSPVNITTFNKNATINNSTWGDTNELSEVQFWTALKNNFESNNCLKPSYGDAATTTPNPTAWANGSVDCAKPDVYDTLLNAPVNVYLYNNQTLGAQVTYANASDGVIRNLIPGNTYKWVKDGDSTVYGYVTVTSNGSDHGTRWVDAGQIRNVRDLGGLPADTDDDGTVDAYVDYGRLFRGEKLWTAPATNLTNLGITKEYDVGDPAEYSDNTRLSSYQNDQVIHYNFDYNSGDENNATSNYMRAWTAVTHIMEDVVNENNPQNIYFHCRVGADRTGTIAYLLEGLLGVPDEERYQEYSLTHLSGLFDRTRYYKQKTSTNNLKFVFMMGYVQTTQDIIDWYMHNPSASSALIQAFRGAMTTSIQPNNNSNNSGNSNSNSDVSSNQANTNNTSFANFTDDEVSNNETSNTKTSGSSSDGFQEPLGVSERKAGSDSSSVDWLAIAAVGAATTGVFSYALSKRSDNNG